MNPGLPHVMIVGGGAAGWLTAAVIAAHHRSKNGVGIKVTLIESRDIPTVGVGEGTWPTMKNTISNIGIKESTLFKRCFAGFKQGGKFVNWVRGNGDYYYHPFTVPLGYGRIDLAPYVEDVTEFANQANFQQQVCEAGLAPRNLGDAEFQGTCNYAYHLDAGAFADLLKEFCKSELKVEHLVDTVIDCRVDRSGYIQYIVAKELGELPADLFIDCTGFASHLLGKKLQIPFIPTDAVLFNDSAMVIQLPYEENDGPITCHTVATAQNCGWIWDIGLVHRRGIGHVYSSEYASDDEVLKNLSAYIGTDACAYQPRKISFQSGYRRTHWSNNCVGVGLSAGFVEPLEATAIMLVEISARYIAENLPLNNTVMKIVSQRFNQQMQYRWQRIIDFLKLHYMLSQREEPYWRAHRDKSSIPDTLKDDLAVWRMRGPIANDFDSSIELFPAASYQYVIYGMGFKPDFARQSYLYGENQLADQIFSRNRKLITQLLQSLPAHRDYINRWLASH